MNVNENYYDVLGIGKESTKEEIKKTYYKLSFIYHPDKGGDVSIFDKIKNAYDVLYNEETRQEYDKKSKWGNNYDESLELLNFEFANTSKIWDEDKLNKWKEKNKLNVVVTIDDDFNGDLEYERWVICKKCGGDGKDTEQKIVFKDEKGKILSYFQGSDECDFCEGVGKLGGKDCYFCGGKGKIGFSDCKTCNGEKRILGKQKLKGIKFPEGETKYKVEKMGHISNTDWGRMGDLWLVKKNN